MEQTVRRLAPGGALWIVTAMRKVMGPKTPAVHRLELSDLAKGLDRHGLANDREARITAWHVAYRFTSLAVRSPPRRGPPPYRRSQSARSRGVSLLPRSARETTHAASYWA